MKFAKIEIYEKKLRKMKSMKIETCNLTSKHFEMYQKCTKQQIDRNVKNLNFQKKSNYMK